MLLHSRALWIGWAFIKYRPLQKKSFQFAQTRHDANFVFGLAVSSQFAFYLQAMQGRFRISMPKNCTDGLRPSRGTLWRVARHFGRKSADENFGFESLIPSSDHDSLSGFAKLIFRFLFLFFPAFLHGNHNPIQNIAFGKTALQSKTHDSLFHSDVLYTDFLLHFVLGLCSLYL